MILSILLESSRLVVLGIVLCVLIIVILDLFLQYRYLYHQQRKDEGVHDDDMPSSVTYSLLNHYMTEASVFSTKIMQHAYQDFLQGKGRVQAEPNMGETLRLRHSWLDKYTKSFSDGLLRIAHRISANSRGKTAHDIDEDDYLTAQDLIFLTRIQRLGLNINPEDISHASEKSLETDITHPELLISLQRFVEFVVQEYITRYYYFYVKPNPAIGHEMRQVLEHTIVSVAEKIQTIHPTTFVIKCILPVIISTLELISREHKRWKDNTPDYKKRTAFEQVLALLSEFQNDPKNRITPLLHPGIPLDTHDGGADLLNPLGPGDDASSADGENEDDLSQLDRLINPSKDEYLHKVSLVLLSRSMRRSDFDCSLLRTIFLDMLTEKGFLIIQQLLEPQSMLNIMHGWFNPSKPTEPPSQRTGETGLNNGGVSSTSSRTPANFNFALPPAASNIISQASIQLLTNPAVLRHSRSVWRMSQKRKRKTLTDYHKMMVTRLRQLLQAEIAKNKLRKDELRAEAAESAKSLASAPQPQPQPQAQQDPPPVVVDQPRVLSNETQHHHHGHGNVHGSSHSIQHHPHPHPPLLTNTTQPDIALDDPQQQQQENTASVSQLVQIVPLLPPNSTDIKELHIDQDVSPNEPKLPSFPRGDDHAIVGDHDEDDAHVDVDLFIPSVSNLTHISNHDHFSHPSTAATGTQPRGDDDGETNQESSLDYSPVISRENSLLRDGSAVSIYRDEHGASTIPHSLQSNTIAIPAPKATNTTTSQHKLIPTSAPAPQLTSFTNTRSVSRQILGIPPPSLQPDVANENGSTMDIDDVRHSFSADAPLLKPDVTEDQTPSPTDEQPLPPPDETPVPSTIEEVNPPPLTEQADAFFMDSPVLYNPFESETDPTALPALKVLHHDQSSSQIGSFSSLQATTPLPGGPDAAPPPGSDADDIPPNHLFKVSVSETDELSKLKQYSIAASLSANLPTEIPFKNHRYPTVIHPHDWTQILTILSTACGVATVNVSSAIPLFDPKPFVGYEICFHLPPFRWAIRRRFSNFLALHQALKSYNLPEYSMTLPNRRLLNFFDNKNFVSTRCEDLEKYLTELMKRSNLLRHLVTRWFIKPNLSSKAGIRDLDGFIAKSQGSASIQLSAPPLALQKSNQENSNDSQQATPTSTMMGSSLVDEYGGSSLPHGNDPASSFVHTHSGLLRPIDSRHESTVSKLSASLKMNSTDTLGMQPAQQKPSEHPTPSAESSRENPPIELKHTPSFSQMGLTHGDYSNISSKDLMDDHALEDFANRLLSSPPVNREAEREPQSLAAVPGTPRGTKKRSRSIIHEDHHGIKPYPGEVMDKLPDGFFSDSPIVPELTLTMSDNRGSFNTATEPFGAYATAHNAMTYDQFSKKHLTGLPNGTTQYNLTTTNGSKTHTPLHYPAQFDPASLPQGPAMLYDTTQLSAAAATGKLGRRQAKQPGKMTPSTNSPFFEARSLHPAYTPMFLHNTGSTQLYYQQASDQRLHSVVDVHVVDQIRLLMLYYKMGKDVDFKINASIDDVVAVLMDEEEENDEEEGSDEGDDTHSDEAVGDVTGKAQDTSSTVSTNTNGKTSTHTGTSKATTKKTTQKRKTKKDASQHRQRRAKREDNNSYFSSFIANLPPIPHYTRVQNTILISLSNLMKEISNNAFSTPVNPTTALLSLIDEIFELKDTSFMRKRLVWLVKIMLNMSGGATLEHHIDSIFNATTVSSYIDWTLQFLCGLESEHHPTNQINTFQSLLALINSNAAAAFGSQACEQAAIKLFVLLQSPKLLNHIMLSIVDLALIQMYPDLEEELRYFHPHGTTIPKEVPSSTRKPVSTLDAYELRLRQEEAKKEKIVGELNGQVIHGMKHFQLGLGHKHLSDAALQEAYEQFKLSRQGTTSLKSATEQLSFQQYLDHMFDASSTSNASVPRRSILRRLGDTILEPLGYRYQAADGFVGQSSIPTSPADTTDNTAHNPTETVADPTKAKSD